MDKDIALFGVGIYAHSAISLLGKESIDCIYDNNSDKWGTEIEGIPVKAFPEKMDELSDKQIIISVSRKYQEGVVSQLKEQGISNYRTIQDIQIEITKEKLEKRTNYIEIYWKAVNWIKNELRVVDAIVVTATWDFLNIKNI